MFNAIETSATYGAAEQAMTAMEWLVAALGIGTVIALLLVGLVLGVEVIARAWRPKRRRGPGENGSRPGDPPPGGARRSRGRSREAYR